MEAGRARIRINVGVWCTVFAGGMQMHARREPKTDRAADQTVRQVERM
jgi:hypothetical protein